MLYWALAGAPLAIYFILIGSLHLRRRPLVTNGWRDTLTLGMACSGLSAIGPMQLFFPMHAASLWPGWVWILLAALYAMSLILVLLWSKPRLVVYGMSPTQFRETLLNSAKLVDNQAEWNGHVLTMPRSGIQLATEDSTTRRVNVVASVGPLRNFIDWVALEREFVKAGREVTSQPTPSGWFLVLFGLGLLFYTIVPIVRNSETALVELQQFLLRL